MRALVSCGGCTVWQGRRKTRYRDEMLLTKGKNRNKIGTGRIKLEKLQNEKKFEIR
jgi:hypothetical protein